jgi:hypothetical protein
MRPRLLGGCANPTQATSYLQQNECTGYCVETTPLFRVIPFAFPVKFASGITCHLKLFMLLVHPHTCNRRIRLVTYHLLFNRTITDLVMCLTITGPYIKIGHVRFSLRPSQPSLHNPSTILSYSMSLNDRLSGLVVRVRFPALPNFLRSCGSGTGSTQPREDN